MRGSYAPTFIEHVASRVIEVPKGLEDIHQISMCKVGGSKHLKCSISLDNALRTCEVPPLTPNGGIEGFKFAISSTILNFNYITRANLY